MTELKLERNSHGEEKHLVDKYITIVSETASGVEVIAS
jgi:hypothetical protein